nr:hypothetical protein [Tanacetum cinerariifolium]
IWDVNAITGRYLSTDFVVCNSKGNMIHYSTKSNVVHNFLRMKEGGIYAVKNFVVVPNKDEYRIFKQDMFMLEFDGETTIRRVTLWGGLGDVLVERKTNHVGMCVVVLTGMSMKDYNNKLYLSSTSCTVIYDDDDIPCIQELKADSRPPRYTKLPTKNPSSIMSVRKLEIELTSFTLPIRDHVQQHKNRQEPKLMRRKWKDHGHLPKMTHLLHSHMTQFETDLLPDLPPWVARSRSRIIMR